MKSLTILKAETLDNAELYTDKCFLGISLDSLVVLRIDSKTNFSIIESIIRGKDYNAVVCEFTDLDDMLDTISIVSSVIRDNGRIFLEQHFNIND